METIPGSVVTSFSPGSALSQYQSARCLNSMSRSPLPIVAARVYWLEMIIRQTRAEIATNERDRRSCELKASPDRPKSLSTTTRPTKKAIAANEATAGIKRELRLKATSLSGNGNSDANQVKATAIATICPTTTMALGTGNSLLTSFQQATKPNHTSRRTTKATGE